MSIVLRSICCSTTWLGMALATGLAAAPQAPTPPAAEEKTAPPDEFAAAPSGEADQDAVKSRDRSYEGEEARGYEEDEKAAPIPPPPAPAAQRAVTSNGLPCPALPPTPGRRVATSRPVRPVTANACPYCGNPDCPRATGERGCCEAIRSALYTHFCFGSPGYLHTPVPPPGHCLHTILGRQIAKGQAALQVLYHYDFLEGSALLSVRGQLELREAIARALRTGCPIVIESTPYRPELARARREQVVAELARSGAPLPPEQVIIAEPPGRPAQSEELPLLYEGFLGLTAPETDAPGPAPPGPLGP